MTARGDFETAARQHVAALLKTLARQWFRRDARNAAVTLCVTRLGDSFDTFAAQRLHTAELKFKDELIAARRVAGDLLTAKDKKLAALQKELAKASAAAPATVATEAARTAQEPRKARPATPAKAGSSQKRTAPRKEGS